METQKTIKIARFMGWSHDQEDSYRKFENGMFKYCLLSNFKFDSDWNALMGVVGKIYTIHEQNDLSVLFNIIRDALSDASIQGTFDAVFNYIEEYNGDKETIQNNKKKDEISSMLIDICDKMGIQTPRNFDDILDFCLEDVDASADPTDWGDGDVAIAFRRWIEGEHNNE